MAKGTAKMSDVIVNLALEKPEDSARLAKALDAYAHWFSEAGHPSEDAPDVMVRTAYDASGSLSKQVIFQDQKWAAAFLRFWRSGRSTRIED